MYEKIIHEQLEEGIVEKAPEKHTGPCVFYMPQKPVVRKEATTTKVRMVFDASAKPVLLPTVSMSVCTLAYHYNLCYETSRFEHECQPIFCWWISKRHFYRSRLRRKIAIHFDSYST